MESHEKTIGIKNHANGLTEEVKDIGGPLRTSYVYNERNERISKTTYDGNGDPVQVTHYVREVSGAVVSVHTEGIAQQLPPVQEEQHLGGMGIYYILSDVYVYALKDHLGNTRATINSQLDANGEVEVLSYADYYPMGMEMPGRVLHGGNDYRYAYAGQEHEAECGLYAFGLRFLILEWIMPNPSSPLPPSQR